MSTNGALGECVVEGVRAARKALVTQRHDGDELAVTATTARLEYLCALAAEHGITLPAEPATTPEP